LGDTSILHYEHKRSFNIRSHILKDRQYNGQKKKNRQYNGQKKKNRQYKPNENGEKDK
jgi:hypothetical protein